MCCKVPNFWIICYNRPCAFSVVLLLSTVYSSLHIFCVFCQLYVFFIFLYYFLNSMYLLFITFCLFICFVNIYCFSHSVCSVQVYGGSKQTEDSCSVTRWYVCSSDSGRSRDMIFSVYCCVAKSVTIFYKLMC